MDNPLESSDELKRCEEDEEIERILESVKQFGSREERGEIRNKVCPAPLLSN